jgi:flavin reductase (DIM6/NTAB) family NADH-FMN oxidoreductase RutF
MRVPVPLARAYRLINHGPVTLLASTAGTRRNVMAASWITILDYDPPELAVVVASDTATRALIDASRSFTLSLPTTQMAAVTLALGRTTGDSTDKLAEHGLATSPASRVHAPLIEGCVGWLECELLADQPAAMTHDLLLARVVAAWADDTVFADDRWQFDHHPELRTIHHVGGGIFVATGELLQFGASSMKLP